MVYVTIKNNQSTSLYDVIRFKLDEAGEEQVGDFYWILQYLKKEPCVPSISDFYKRELTTFRKEVKCLEDNEKIHFPCSISDQAIVFLTVKRLNNKFLNVYFSISITLCGGEYYPPILDPKFRLGENDEWAIVDAKVISEEDFFIRIYVE